MKERKAPELNVISIEEFEQTARRVFELMLETLGRSFGPYGSQTIIYKHPFSHITKDGFTIAHSLSMNVAETYTPEAIMNMALSICGRTNSAVGDGTTTAIVATSNIYQSYLKRKEELQNQGFLPRDILYAFNSIKERIRMKLGAETTPIVGENVTNEMLAESIRKIVTISSNGDETITNTIVDLYRKLGFPAITCEKSKDGEERAHLIDGFSLKMYITDEMYINNDEKTLKLQNANVLMFGCKITTDIFQSIIMPAWRISLETCTKLIVAAPSWDEVLIDRTIAPILRKQFRANHDVGLIVAAYKASNIYQKKAAEDFAMLCHTELIDRARAMELIQKTNPSILDVHDATPEGEFDKNSIFSVMNFRRPYLTHVPYPICIPVKDKAVPHDSILGTYYVQAAHHEFLNDEDGNAKEISYLINLKETGGALAPGWDMNNEMMLDIGYVEDITMGLETTIARKFYYDANMYELHLREAESNLEKVTQKYKKLGTFNTELSKAQERVYGLRMKMATIEVGGNSELSMGLRKDVYDDAIHAAESAYKYGVINGCNVSTIRCALNILNEVQDGMDEYIESLYEPIARIILIGFINTYRRVLSNWIEDYAIVRFTAMSNKELVRDWFRRGADDDIKDGLDEFFEKYISHVSDLENVYDLFGIPKEGLDEEERREKFDDLMFEYLMQLLNVNGTDEILVSLFDILIMHSVNTNQVFDLSTKQFSKDIINSFQTDDEILNAVIDLLSLLISGNQMVVTQKHSFEE